MRIHIIVGGVFCTLAFLCIAPWKSQSPGSGEFGVVLAGTDRIEQELLPSALLVDLKQDPARLARKSERTPESDEGAPGTRDVKNPMLPSSHGSTIQMSGEDCIVTWDGTTRKIHAVSGELLVLGVFVDGRRQGLHRGWHKNGMLRGDYPYLTGKAHGDHRSYGETGVLVRSVHYENGVKHGPSMNYFDNGLLYKGGEFRNGFRSGWWDIYESPGELDTDRSGFYLNGNFQN